MSQLSVDIGHHVITNIKVYHADNQYLQDIVARPKRRLHKQGFIWKNIVADTGYSDGENYSFFRKTKLKCLLYSD